MQLTDYPKALVVGATGMAGQAFSKALTDTIQSSGTSRNGPDIFEDPSRKRLISDKI